MKICEQIKIKLLDGSVCSDEEMRHIGTCPECQDLAAFIKRMDGLPAMEQEVPAYLDHAILHAAADSMPKPHWNPVIWKIAIPLAAAFAFVAGLLFYQPSGSDLNQNDSVIVQKKRTKQRSVTRQTAAKSNARQNLADKPADKKVKQPVQNDTTFDEQVLALAIDVGSGVDYLPESIDSVSETLDLII